MGWNQRLNVALLLPREVAVGYAVFGRKWCEAVPHVKAL
jgi:hypothetical protein